MNPARVAAFESLTAIEKNKRYSNLELDAKLKAASLSDRDKRLYTTLVYGVIERKITLDFLIETYAHRKLSEIDHDLGVILRIALYQIRFLDKIPPHAILNEAAELAKTKRRKRGADFVTGVLRAAINDNSSLEVLTENLSELKKLSVIYSLPEWMLDLWIEAYGAPRAEAIAKAFLSPVNSTVFVNLQKCSVDKLLSLFAENGIKTQKIHDTLPLLRFSAPAGDIRKIPGYESGYFFVQDRACAIAVDEIKPQAGNKIADLCAAPGGKSFAAAILSGDQASIRSSDLHENKLSLIKSGAKRLGLKSIEVSCRDARDVLPEEKGAYDKVICDVPCSGLGVLAKKPDLRHKDPSEITRLPEIQLAILSSGATLLKPGGELLYSTCTLNPRENENVLFAFLRDHPDFTLAKPPVTLFPEAGVSDGFFYGVLKCR